MQFAEASLGDLTDISRIFHDCWHISYKDLLSKDVREAMSLVAAEELWRPSLENPQDRQTIVGKIGQEILSVFRIGSDKDVPRSGHLFSLYVSPSASGNGYGGQSLEEAMARIRKKGFTEMTLWVFKENMVANSLYRKYGFLPTGRTRIDERWRADEIELRKENL